MIKKTLQALADMRKPSTLSKRLIICVPCLDIGLKG